MRRALERLPRGYLLQTTEKGMGAADTVGMSNTRTTTGSLPPEAVQAQRGCAAPPGNRRRGVRPRAAIGLADPIGAKPVQECCWLLSLSLSSAAGVLSPSLTALRKPLMALPTSEPRPGRRLVPHSSTTLSRVVASCQILIPIISLNSSVPTSVAGVTVWIHRLGVHVMPHTAVLRSCGLLQELLVDVAEGYYPCALVSGGQCLGGLALGKGGQRCAHGAFQPGAGDVPGLGGIDQVRVVGLIPVAATHVMDVEAQLQDTVLRLQ